MKDEEREREKRKGKKRGSVTNFLALTSISPLSRAFAPPVSSAGDVLSCKPLCMTSAC